MARSADALTRYEQRTGAPLLVVSLLYLGLVFYLLLPDAPAGHAFLFLDGAFWTVFVLDWAYRVFWLAPHPWRYAFTPLCILDLIVVLSFPVLALVHIGLLAEARIPWIVVQILRILRGGAQAVRTAGRARCVFSRRSLRWLVPSAIVLTVMAAFLAWRYETASPSSNIQSWQDAAWWAVVTLMTVGYGDLYPKTAEGRIAGVVVMVVGITLFGWVTASLASMFVESDEGGDRSELIERLDAIADRLTALEAHLDGNGRHSGLGDGETVLVVRQAPSIDEPTHQRSETE